VGRKAASVEMTAQIQGESKDEDFPAFRAEEDSAPREVRSCMD
jgi:hypothetical protein